MEKRTKVVVLREIAEVVKDNEEYRTLIEKIIDQTEKKNATKRETPTQKENAIFKEIILNRLSESNEPKTISEIQVTDERLGAISNQRMTAILTQMVNTDKTVIRVMDKKRAKFAIAD